MLIDNSCPINPGIMKKMLFLFSVLVIGCSEDLPGPKESFFRIYDDANATLDYRPIDVVETTEGFIVLAGTVLDDTDFSGVQLIQLNKRGEFLQEASFEDLVAPVGKMHLIDSVAYFFAMDPTSLQPFLLGVSPNLNFETQVSIPSLNYPLASGVTSGGQLLLESYDSEGLRIELSLIDLEGNVQETGSYDIGPGTDVELEIIDHYLDRNERRLPFFCGEVGSGTYYFNGFYNYNFSLVFSNLGDTPAGVVQGQTSNAGIRAVLPLSGSNFAVAGFQFDENFQLADAAINTGGISSSVNLYPGDMAELKSYTPTEIVSYSDGSRSYTVFAAETESRQINLYFYESGSGEIAGIYRVGYLYPYTLASVKVTQDNSILVLGTTFVADRFERAALTKISTQEIRGVL